MDHAVDEKSLRIDLRMDVTSVYTSYITEASLTLSWKTLYIVTWEECIYRRLVFDDEVERIHPVDFPWSRIQCSDDNRDVPHLTPLDSYMYRGLALWKFLFLHIYQYAYTVVIMSSCSNIARSLILRSGILRARSGYRQASQVQIRWSSVSQRPGSDRYGSVKFSKKYRY